MKAERSPEAERGLWFARAWVGLYLALIVLVSLVPAEFHWSGRRLMRHRGLSHTVFVGGRGTHSRAGLAGALRAAYVTALVALSFLPYDVTVSAGRIHLFLSTPWDGSRIAGALLTLSLLAVFGALSWLSALGSTPPPGSSLSRDSWSPARSGPGRWSSPRAPPTWSRCFSVRTGHSSASGAPGSGRR